MENMNIENVVEEVVENIEETVTAQAPVQKHLVTAGEATLISAGVYLTLKYGGKLLAKGKKCVSDLWAKRKNKKTKAVKEDEVFETPIAEIDEGENK